MNKNIFSSEDKQGISPKNANLTLFNLSRFNKKPVEVRFSLDETPAGARLYPPLVRDYIAFLKSSYCY